MSPLCKDEYIYSTPMTIGGNESPGIFSVDCPFSGDSYEFSVFSISSFSGTGIVYVSTSDIRSVPEPNLNIGDLGSAPAGFLPGFYFSIPGAGTIIPSTDYLRLPVGSKRVYMCTNTTSYVTILFRMLPVKIIPARTMTYPDVASEQANIARSERVIERLELDIEKGDSNAAYGRLQ